MLVKSYTLLVKGTKEGNKNGNQNFEGIAKINGMHDNEMINRPNGLCPLVVRCFL